MTYAPAKFEGAMSSGLDDGQCIYKKINYLTSDLYLQGHTKCCELCTSHYMNLLNFAPVKFVVARFNG